MQARRRQPYIKTRRRNDPKTPSAFSDALLVTFHADSGEITIENTSVVSKLYAKFGCTNYDDLISSGHVSALSDFCGPTTNIDTWMQICQGLYERARFEYFINLHEWDTGCSRACQIQYEPILSNDCSSGYLRVLLASTPGVNRTYKQYRYGNFDEDDYCTDLFDMFGAVIDHAINNAEFPKINCTMLPTMKHQP
jgi:hypothetical protein